MGNDKQNPSIEKQEALENQSCDKASFFSKAKSAITTSVCTATFALSMQVATAGEKKADVDSENQDPIVLASADIGTSTNLLAKCGSKYDYNKNGKIDEGAEEYVCTKSIKNNETKERIVKGEKRIAELNKIQKILDGKK